MIVGIDASNIRAGGGVTPLAALLKHGRPREHGIDRVIVWATKTTLRRLPSPEWMDAESPEALNGSALQRLSWQYTKLTKRASETCDLLFVPGGSYLGGFRPFVTMFQ